MCRRTTRPWCMAHGPIPPIHPIRIIPYGDAAATAAFAFTAGVALGAAWGYAWGGCNWRGGDVDINVNRNTNFNTNINRQRYQANFQARGLNAAGAWRHDATTPGGVAYRDQGTAQRFNRGTKCASRLRPGKRFAAEPRVVGKNSRAAEQTGSGKRGRERARRSD